MMLLPLIFISAYGCVRFENPVTAINLDSQSSRLLIGLANGNVHCLQFNSCQWASSFHEYEKSVTALCALQEGHVIGYEDGSLFTEIAGSKNQLIEKHKNKISSIVRTGDFFVVGSYDQSVSIWRSDGLFLFQTMIGSEVTALAVDNTGETIFIGCLDGKVYCLSGATLSLSLLDVPVMGPVSCLAVGANSLSVGIGNTVLLYNREYKGYKPMQTSQEVCALSMRDSNKTIVVLCKKGDMYVFDEPSGAIIEHYVYMQPGLANSSWRVAICADKIGTAIGDNAYIHCIVQDPLFEISIMSDLVVDGFKSLLIVDSFGFVVGERAMEAGVHKAKMILKPRYRNVARENFIVLQKTDNTSVLYKIRHSLARIKKMLVAQALNDGEICICYGTMPASSDRSSVVTWHIADLIASSAAIGPCVSPTLNVVLYSMNVAIKNALLEKPGRVLAQGVNIEGGGAVWRFQDALQRCEGSCVLSILTEFARYSWYIHHITEQSEFLLSECIPSVSKKIEQNGLSFNDKEKDAFAGLIAFLRGTGSFLKLSHYVEHLNQSYEVPLTSVIPAII